MPKDGKNKKEFKMAEETPEQKKERRETILAIITMGAIFLLFEVGVIAWAGRIKKHDEKKITNKYPS